jgi:transposase
VSKEFTFAGKGKRIIIAHTGDASGFIGRPLILHTKSENYADYHKEMNAENFEKWFREDVFPSLPESSIIVLDNASYHCRKIDRKPTMSHKKDTMIKWLEKHNQGQNLSGLRKIDLMDMINTIPFEDKFYLDNLCSEKNISVVRLPPYHCHFNPIEMIWSMLKSYIGWYNYDGKLSTVDRLISEGFERITPQMWDNCVEHVKKEELIAFHGQESFETIFEDLITGFSKIDLDDGDDDDDDDESDDDFVQDSQFTR